MRREVFHAGSSLTRSSIERSKISHRKLVGKSSLHVHLNLPLNVDYT